MMKAPLTEAIEETCRQERYRFHVPAHAGRALSQDHEHSYLPATRDLTELPALDVLGNPTGVLSESQMAAAALFGTKRTFYLINGASVGIMAALLATGLQEGHTILVARNAHRSVLHGLVLTGAMPIWLTPVFLPEWGLWGALDPTTLEQQLTDNPTIRAVVLTHPTYEGVPSAIREIREICSRHNVLLIVDEAHGSLWPLSADFPLSSLEVGADVVVHSLHKSGGSLTQTALLHLPQGSLLPEQALQEALNILQTTSPSYLLLENLEQTCMWLDSPTGRIHLQEHRRRVQELTTWIDTSLKSIRRLNPVAGQHTLHLFLKSTQYSGEELGTLLEERYNIAYEATTPRGMLLMLNLGLPESAFQALKQALTAIDVVSGQHSEFLYPKAQISLPQCAMSPRRAFFLPGIQIHRNHAVGRIAKQVIAPCPPGIPMLMPGEIIQEAHRMHLPENIMVVASSSVKKVSPASSVERQRGSKTADPQKHGSSRSRTEA